MYYIYVVVYHEVCKRSAYYFYFTFGNRYNRRNSIYNCYSKEYNIIITAVSKLANRLQGPTSLGPSCRLRKCYLCVGNPPATGALVFPFAVAWKSYGTNIQVGVDLTSIWRHCNGPCNPPLCMFQIGYWSVPCGSTAEIPWVCQKACEKECHWTRIVNKMYTHLDTLQLLDMVYLFSLNSKRADFLKVLHMYRL